MIKAEAGGKKFEIEKKGNSVIVNGDQVVFDTITIAPGKQHWICKNKSYTVELESIDRKEKKCVIRINGKPVSVTLKSRLDELLHEMGMDTFNSKKVNDLKAPMPGLVLDIVVTEGQQIKKGETVVVLEAMKMENSLKAPADVKVKKIIAVKGSAVEKNQVLVEFEN